MTAIYTDTLEKETLRKKSEDRQKKIKRRIDWTRMKILLPHCLVFSESYSMNKSEEEWIECDKCRLTDHF